MICRFFFFWCVCYTTTVTWVGSDSPTGVTRTETLRLRRGCQGVGPSYTWTFFYPDPETRGHGGLIPVKEKRFLLGCRGRETANVPV